MGWIVNSHQGLAGLLASSAKFRTIVGAASESAALDYIHFPYPLLGTAEAPLDDRPWGIIDDGEGTEFEEEVRRSASGSLVMTVEVPASYYSSATDDKQLWLAFAQDCDTIYDEMVENSNKANGSENYWNLAGMSKLGRPEIVPKQNGDPAEPYCSWSILCRWV